jgi:chemotaxis signal transduction protein
MAQFLLFRIKDRRYGIDLPLVRGIRSAGAEGMSSAQSALQLSGLLTDRKAETQNIASLRETTAEKRSPRLILAAAGNRLLALGVEQIEQVISAADEAVVPMSPIFEGMSLDCFPKVLKHAGELILVLNPESILKYRLRETGDFSFYHPGEKDPTAVHIEEIGSEIDTEFDLPASVLAEEDAAAIARRIKQESVSDMILRISSHILEKTVSRELGRVEKVWKCRVGSLVPALRK